MKSLSKLFLALVMLSVVGLSSCSRTMHPSVDDIVQIGDLFGKWQAMYDSNDWPPVSTVPDSIGFLFHEFYGDTVDTWFLSPSGTNDTPIYTSLVSVDSILGPNQAVLEFNPYSYTVNDTTIFLGSFSAPFEMWIELNPGVDFTVIRQPNGDTLPQIRYLYVD